MTEGLEQTAVRYLLGRMEEGERTAFEMRYLGDPALSEAVAAVESELLDDYLAGALPAEEREAFERNLLTTREQKNRLASAQALRAAFARSRPRPERKWTNAAIAAGLGGILATALLLSSPSRDDRPAKQPEVASAPAAEAPPASGVGPPPPVTVPGAASVGERTMVTIVLSAVMTRGGDGSAATTLAGDEETVRIVVGLQPGDDEFARYGVLLQTASGEPILEIADVPLADDRSLTIDVAAKRLPAGDYEVLVDGHPSSGTAEPLGVWPFAISRP